MAAIWLAGGWLGCAGPPMGTDVDRISRTGLEFFTFLQSRGSSIAEIRSSLPDARVDSVFLIDPGVSNEELADFVLRQGIVARQDGGEAVAALVLHHQIGGVVGLEEAMDSDDVWVVKTDQGLGFLAEALKAPFEILPVVGAGRMHRAVLGISDGEAGGRTGT